MLVGWLAGRMQDDLHFYALLKHRFEIRCSRGVMRKREGRSRGPRKVKREEPRGSKLPLRWLADLPRPKDG